MTSVQEIIRLATYAGVGVLPIFIILVSFLLKLNVFAIALLTFFVTLLFAFIAWVYTSNPLQRIVAGQEYGVLNFDSKGHLQFFSAKVEGDQFVAHMGNQVVKQKFNRNLFWYVSTRIKNAVLKSKEFTDENGNVKTKLIAEEILDEKNVSNAMFKTDYPFLVYSNQLKQFITKEWLFKREYDSMFFNFGWELKTSIDEHNRAAGGITRYILDLIAAKSKSPQTQKFLIIIVAVVVGILAFILFGPMVYEIIDGSVGDPTGATQLVENKLT